MGFFDRFGVGGGSLAIQLHTQSAAPGGMVSGVLVFTGGSRAQNITALLVGVNVTCPPPPGSNASQETKAVVPQTKVTNAFAVQPGQTVQMPFQFALPPGIPGSFAGQTTYQLYASADIDGEIDPGATVELQVTGGYDTSKKQGYDPSGYGAQPAAKLDPKAMIYCPYCKAETPRGACRSCGAPTG